MNKIVLLLVLPLLLAFIVPVLARYSSTLARLSGPMLFAFLLGLIISAWSSVGDGAAAVYIGGFLPPLGIVFVVDQLALLFSALIAVTFFVLWPWGQQSESRIYSLYLLLAASSFGLVISGDLFNLYVFYELMAVASFGLIAKQDNYAANAAALRYLFISSAGSVMLLIGIAIIYTQTGTLTIAHLSELAPVKLHNTVGFSAFVLIIIGAGVKAEMFPVNSWVSEVYGVVSRPLAAMLAGLISKLAVVFIVRLLLMMYQQDAAFQLLLVLGVLGVISGELVAWRVKDMLRMLSFSSIAQLGLIFIAFSIPGEDGLWVGLALMLHHLLVKGGLFLLAEKLNGSFEQLRGMAKRAPYATAIFVIFALSLLGVPPLPGFWVKLMLILNLAGQQSAMYSYAIAFVLIATVVESAYLFRLVRLMFDQQQPAVAATESTNGKTYALSYVMVLVLIVAMFYISPIQKSLHGIAKQSADRQQYIETVFPGMTALHREKILPLPAKLSGDLS